MTILTDTNVLLDVLLKRAPHFASSYEVLHRATAQGADLLTTAASVTDIYYVLRKSGVPDPEIRTGLRNLLTVVRPADVRAEDVRAALDSPLADFEDALAAEVARRLKCDAIVTRNAADFEGSHVKVLTPDGFLKAFPAA